jgi:hypothetical protein
MNHYLFFLLIWNTAAFGKSNGNSFDDNFSQMGDAFRTKDSVTENVDRHYCLSSMPPTLFLGLSLLFS